MRTPGRLPLALENPQPIDQHKERPRMTHASKRSGASKQTTRPQTAREKTLRGWAALLKLPAVCDQAACRRAGACRGAIRECAAENFARLPEGVKGLACCLLDARAKGLGFDDAMKGFAGSEAQAAWTAWCAEHPQRA